MKAGLSVVLATEIEITVYEALRWDPQSSLGIRRICPKSVLLELELDVEC